MDNIVTWGLDHVNQLKDWWTGLNTPQQTGMLAAAGLTGFCLLIGGPLAHGCVLAAISNLGFWLMLKESPRAIQFLSKHGLKADVGITAAAGLCTSGAVSSLYFVVLFGVMFTIFRRIFAPSTNCARKGEPATNNTSKGSTIDVDYRRIR